MILIFAIVILVCGIVIFGIKMYFNDKTKSLASFLPNFTPSNGTKTFNQPTNTSKSINSSINTITGININKSIGDYTEKFYITSTQTGKYLTSDGTMVSNIGYATQFTHKKGVISPQIGGVTYIITQIGSDVVLSDSRNLSMGLVVNGLTVTNITSTTTSDTPENMPASRPDQILTGGGPITDTTTATTNTSIPIPTSVKLFGSDKVDNTFLVNIISSS